MPLEVGTITGPSFLASALINGDESGLELPDKVVLQQFLADLPEGAFVVDCSEESWFERWHGIGHDVCEYTYHVHNYPCCCDQCERA